MKKILGFIFLLLFVSSVAGTYPAPYQFAGPVTPPISMPELQSINISRDFVFPEPKFVELELDPNAFQLENISEDDIIETENEPVAGTDVLIENDSEIFTPAADELVESSEDIQYSADVIVYQQGQNIIAETADGKELATAPISSDVSGLFKIAVDAVPDGGSLHIGSGKYSVSAPYEFALNPDGTNIFYNAIQVLDKDMHISGDGVDETIIQLLPGQRSPARHVAMVLIRGTRGFDPGYDEFSVADLTLDGNRGSQTDGQPHDGEGLILVGSERTDGYYYNLHLENSWGSGIYLGNNGAGNSGTNETVSHVVARNCGAEGIILDTCHHSRVIDCECWQCREGVVLYGNDDWESRTPDDVSASRFKTDSQVTVWQVNDFKLSEIDMDCTNTIGSYGLMIRDGTGTVENSVLVSSKDRADSTGGATYIIEGSDVKIIDSRLEGYFGVHAIGRAKVEVTNCRIDAPGGCFCTTDPAPVQSTIIVKNCTCSGLRAAMQTGAMLIEG